MSEPPAADHEIAAVAGRCDRPRRQSVRDRRRTRGHRPLRIDLPSGRDRPAGAQCQPGGLAFGLKFILAFGISGFGVQLEGAFYDRTGGLTTLFVVLGQSPAVGFAAACLLPSERRKTALATTE